MITELESGPRSRFLCTFVRIGVVIVEIHIPFPPPRRSRGLRTAVCARPVHCGTDIESGVVADRRHKFEMGNFPLMMQYFGCGSQMNKRSEPQPLYIHT